MDCKKFRKSLDTRDSQSKPKEVMGWKGRSGKGQEHGRSCNFSQKEIKGGVRK